MNAYYPLWASVPQRELTHKPGPRAIARGYLTPFRDCARMGTIACGWYFGKAKGPWRVAMFASEPVHAPFGEETSMKLTTLAFFASLVFAAAAPAYEPTSNYTIKNVEGWKVYVNNGLLKGKHADVGAKVLKKLKEDLADVKARIPDRPLKELIKVPIWLEVDTTNGPRGRTPTFHYHPGMGWLKKMDFNPAKHQCVEFSRAAAYANRGKSSVVLHELAHGYHDRVLGFNDGRILAAYKNAVAGKAYRPRDWARSRHTEYFCAVTQRYFGRKEERERQKKDDPAIVKIMKQVWGEPKSYPDDPPAKELKVTEIPKAVRDSLGLDAFYKKYASARGLPVLASKKVSDYALLEAAYLINHMLEDRPRVRKALIDKKVRFVVMGATEMTTAIPEYSSMKPSKFWDRRARGLGPTRQRPAVSCGEENLLGYPGDPYRQESILVHEFAHAVHVGIKLVDKSFDGKLKALYEKAMKKGLWKGKYAANNRSEYWAEGVQSWFDTNRLPDHDHNHVNTREELRKYDPDLAELITGEFRNSKWRYRRPVDRKYGGHLAGYDPKKAPRFAWPDGLNRSYREYERKQKAAKKDAAKDKGPATKRGN